jgi:hypothetical protein
MKKPIIPVNPIVITHKKLTKKEIKDKEDEIRKKIISAESEIRKYGKIVKKAEKI